jgi:hypothetical protein
MSIRLALISFLLLQVSNSFSQNKSDVKLGAYYFNGWQGERLKNVNTQYSGSFKNRVPRQGWHVNGQHRLDSELLSASNSGLSFFSFCWYFTGKESFKDDPLNSAVNYYLKSPSRKKMDYCLLVANHQGAEIGPVDWSIVTAEWLSQFSNKGYLRTNGKPLIIFFSVQSLVKNFGSIDEVRFAINSFRSDAHKAGIGDIAIAACINPSEKEIQDAIACGIDTFTGYNYHAQGFTIDKHQIPIDSMRTAERRIWNRFTTNSQNRYIPVSTLNWDPRPWANANNKYNIQSYFTGFSEESVRKSVASCVSWINHNPSTATPEKLGLLYAWNEYGEGAWLTPGKDGYSPLNGVIKALHK